MYRARTLLILSILLVFSFACRSKPDATPTETGPNPAFLVHIPADTTYGFAALEPMPEAAVSRILAGASSIMTPMMQSLRDELHYDNDDRTRLALALLDALQTRISPEGLAELGIASRPRFAVYALGFLPVLRVELEDPARFEAFLQTIHEEAGVEPSIGEINGVSFYRIFEYEDHFVSVSIHNQVASFGIVLPELHEKYLPLLIGATLPERSFAEQDQFRQLVSRHGFQPWSVGFVDSVRVAELLMGRVTGIDALVAEAFELTPASEVNDTCFTEWMSLVEVLPRVVFGGQSYGEQQSISRIGVEITNDVGARLAQARAPIPAANHAYMQDSMIYAGFGADVGQIIELVYEKLVAMRDANYQCHDLQMLAASAGEVLPFMAMVPPFVQQIRGIGGIVLSMPQAQRVVQQEHEVGLAMQGETETVPPGFLVVASQDPVTLFDAIRTFQPALSGLQVEVGKAPVRFELPELGATPAFVALTSRAIGVSTGTGNEGALGAVLDSFLEEDAIGIVRADLRSAFSLLSVIFQIPMLQDFAENMGRLTFFAEPTGDALFLRIQSDYE